MGLRWRTESREAVGSRLSARRWRRTPWILAGLLIVFASAGVTYAHWLETLEVSADIGTGELILNVSPGTPPSFDFDCVKSPASCTPAPDLHSTTFTNNGSIPVAVYLKWGPADVGFCALFDVTMTTPDGTVFSGDLCTLVASADGVQVTPQLDPDDDIQLDIAVSGDTDDIGWDCPVDTLNLTSQVIFGQWSTLPPYSAGWWDQDPADPFTIDMAAVTSTLTVIKHVDTGGVGTATADWWTMNVSGGSPSDPSFPGAESPGTTITIQAGAYSVTESGGAGAYTPGYSAQCSGTTTGGETLTCTITNTYTAPTWPQTLTESPVAFTRPSATAQGNNVVKNVGGTDTITIVHLYHSATGPTGPWVQWLGCSGIDLVPGGTCTAPAVNPKPTWMRVEYIWSGTTYNVVFDFLNLRVVP